VGDWGLLDELWHNAGFIGHYIGNNSAISKKKDTDKIVRDYML